MRSCPDLYRASRVCAWVCVLLVLAACGQRGPLVLPDSAPAAPTEPDTGEDDDDNGSER